MADPTYQTTMPFFIWRVGKETQQSAFLQFGPLMSYLVTCSFITTNTQSCFMTLVTLLLKGINQLIKKLHETNVEQLNASKDLLWWHCDLMDVAGSI